MSLCRINLNAVCLALAVCHLSGGAYAEDHPLPYGPFSREIEEFQGRIEEVDDFSVFSVDDPALKVAYKRVFLSIIGDQLQSNQPEVVAAFADLKRRGDSVTPMLLKLMRENQENQLEAAILSGITAVDTIDVQPFVDYARSLLKERVATMNAVLAASAAKLLEKRGSKEDSDLLRWVIETRPYVAVSVESPLRHLDLRLAAEKRLGAQPTKENRNAAEARTEGVEASDRSAKREPMSERNASAGWLIPALGLLTAILLIGAVVRLWVRNGTART